MPMKHACAWAHDALRDGADGGGDEKSEQRENDNAGDAGGRQRQPSRHMKSPHLHVDDRREAICEEQRQHERHEHRLEKNNASRLIDRLEQAGLVRREAHPGDGRGQWVAITPEGRALQKRMWKVYGPAIEQHVGAKLTRGEAAQLAALLEKLIKLLTAKLARAASWQVKALVEATPISGPA